MHAQLLRLFVTTQGQAAVGTICGLALPGEEHGTYNKNSLEISHGRCCRADAEKLLRLPGSLHSFAAEPYQFKDL